MGAPASRSGSRPTDGAASVSTKGFDPSRSPGMSDELRAALERARDWHKTATPEEKEAMWAAQRESWIRAFGPCEHGEYDWETCPQCLSEYRK